MKKTYHILMRIEEALEAVLFALVEDLDEVFKELHVVLATVNKKKGERRWSAGG